MLHIDTGNTGFMILCTSLVMLMTPGLAFFYGGLAGKRNILGIMIQSFVSMGITTIMWFVVGYSLCFSGDSLGGLIGNLDKVFMHGVDLNSPFPGNHKLPEFVFMAYQMMFAIITPALISGAFATASPSRRTSSSSSSGNLLVYYPLRRTWSGAAGCSPSGGCIDFAGGIVVHATAGFAALASVFFVGKRRDRESRPAQHPPHRHRHRAALVRLVWV